MTDMMRFVVWYVINGWKKSVEIRNVHIALPDLKHH